MHVRVVHRLGRAPGIVSIDGRADPRDWVGIAMETLRYFRPILR